NEFITESLVWYDNPATLTGRHTVATYTLFNNGTYPLSGGDNGVLGHLTDVSTSSAILSPTDPAIGHQIGILFNTDNAGDPNTAGGHQWDLENVRLATAVPEPGTLSLLALTG